MYKGTVYRPPLESNTLLLPITEGCSHNSCSFCSMYQGVVFRMLKVTEVEAYLQNIKLNYEEYSNYIKRIYLVGADPFVLSTKKLIERISLIRRYLPNIEKITMYARTDNIASKSDDDLIELKELGVDDLYVGVECGLNDVMKTLNKGYSADETCEQCLRLNKIGIKHNSLLMLGTAGRGRGQECARATAKLENEIKPVRILINTMTSFQGTKLEEDIKTGKFIQPSEKENLEEEMEILERLELPECYFWAAHPLDEAKIEGFLKENKQRMLDILSWKIEHLNENSIIRVSRVGTL
ncbi:MAG: radical SAM protein [Succinivibrio dextrinosolvens]|uniref:radical SAM protein n=1 Tax=Succinivibrio sp. TaxID=2053619 RepID=UPI0025E09B19|nr:radical SAM protein [Succinivibrio sp.]MBQ9221879.1 radical SAM protein [Succinivibrio sp.]MDY6419063.1 radical SAM protein [Succinivibrio dextrinosolvens]MDY6470934.1 radical SAM protein [Succinivibrio dextrinosolvens]